MKWNALDPNGADKKNILEYFTLTKAQIPTLFVLISLYL